MYYQISLSKNALEDFFFFVKLKRGECNTRNMRFFFGANLYSNMTENQNVLVHFSVYVRDSGSIFLSDLWWCFYSDF